MVREQHMVLNGYGVNFVHALPRRLFLLYVVVVVVCWTMEDIFERTSRDSPIIARDHGSKQQLSESIIGCECTYGYGEEMLSLGSRCALGNTLLLNILFSLYRGLVSLVACVYTPCDGCCAQQRFYALVTV